MQGTVEPDSVEVDRADGRALDTPHLQIAYAPRDYRAFRETGATWRIITGQTPEPKYLGSIRILAVKPTEAVARPTTGSAVLHVGDQVTSSIRRR